MPGIPNNNVTPQKLPPVYTLQKILKEYNIDMADHIVEALYHDIIRDRRSRARYNGQVECLATDIEIENLRILKKKEKFCIELKFMDEHFRYYAERKYDPLGCLAWIGKLEYDFIKG